MDVEKELPLVTIGMPCYNNGATISAAIQSIIRQTYEKWELLIVDDGSTDRSCEIARQFLDPRIRVIEDGKNQGRSVRRNQAARMGTGMFYACMDSDDLSYPQRIEKQVAFLQEHQEIDLLGTAVLVFDKNGKANGRLDYKVEHEEICSKPWAGIRLAGATFMGRREWFITNAYREDLNRAEDQELLLRTYRNSRFYCLPELLYAYRVEGLQVKKIWNDRYILGKELIRHSLRYGAWGNAVYALIGQITKGMIDGFAIKSGLEYKILRHRAKPIAENECNKWGQLWRDCSG